MRAGAEAASVVEVAEMNRRLVSGPLVGMCHAQGVSGVPVLDSGLGEGQRGQVRRAGGGERR